MVSLADSYDHRAPNTPRRRSALALPILQAASTLPSTHFTANPTVLQPNAGEGFTLFSREADVQSLYLHVPFCFHKCHYCDFYSLVDADPQSPDSRQDAFVDALIAEMGHVASRCTLKPVTIFVGGGTPTLLRVDLWQRLLDAMRHHGLLDAVREFTVEANPETVSLELLDCLAGAGVNRLSIGAQSFNPAHLKTLERWHDPDKVSHAVVLAQQAGITNVNLDLIFAIPGQTAGDLQADLQAALACNPTHLSCYSLIFEPNTALAVKRNLGQIKPAEETLERDLYTQVIDCLALAGFEHYEVSNWAKPGCRCEHNLAYWFNRDYVGLGPSASSHVQGRRWKNVARLGDYLAGQPTPPTQDHEQLDPGASLGEQLMLRLRLLEGASRDWLEPRLDAPRRNEIDELIQLKLLEQTDTHIRLTRQGLYVADALIARLL